MGETRSAGDWMMGEEVYLLPGSPAHMLLSSFFQEFQDSQTHVQSAHHVFEGFC